MPERWVNGCDNVVWVDTSFAETEAQRDGVDANGRRMCRSSFERIVTLLNSDQKSTAKPESHLIKPQSVNGIQSQQVLTSVSPTNGH